MFGNKTLLKDLQCQELSAILKRSSHDSTPGLGNGLPSPFTVSEGLFQTVRVSREEQKRSLGVNLSQLPFSHRRTPLKTKVSETKMT